MIDEATNSDGTRRFCSRRGMWMTQKWATHRCADFSIVCDLKVWDDGRTRATFSRGFRSVSRATAEELLRMDAQPTVRELMLRADKLEQFTASVVNYDPRDCDHANLVDFLKFWQHAEITQCGEVDPVVAHHHVRHMNDELHAFQEFSGRD
jgi:hypothetical protein